MAFSLARRSDENSEKGQSDSHFHCSFRINLNFEYVILHVAHILYCIFQILYYV